MQFIFHNDIWIFLNVSQALVSFKKYMPPTLPYFKVNICPFPLPHFASIFFAYLWSFRWPNDIVTLPRYFSFRLSHLNIPTGPPQTNWTRIFSERSLFYLERILKMTNVPINTVKNNNKAAPYFERFNIPTVLMVMFIV